MITMFLFSELKLTVTFNLGYKIQNVQNVIIHDFSNFKLTYIQGVMKSVYFTKHDRFKIISFHVF